MLKNILYDYWNGRKQAWKNIHESRIYTMIFIAVWYSIILGNSTEWNDILWIQEFVSFTACILLVRMYPNQLSKMLILCPMSKKERKQYLVTGYVFRIMINLIVYVIGEILVIMFYKQFRWEQLGGLVVLFVFSIAENLYFVPKKNMQYGMKREYDTSVSMSVLNYILEIVSLIEMLILASTMDPAWVGWDLSILIAIFAIEVILSVKIIKGRYQLVMDMGVKYEFCNNNTN